MERIEDGCILDPETNCLLWIRRKDMHGTPMEGRMAGQRSPGRARWLRAYKLDLPRTTQLRSICRQRLCVAPWHRCLAKPLLVLKEQGISSWRLSRLRGVMRRRAEGDQSWPVTWLGGLEPLRCAPYAAEQLATAEDISVLSVLAIYATLIPKEVK